MRNSFNKCGASDMSWSAIYLIVVYLCVDDWLRYMQPQKVLKPEKEPKGCWLPSSDLITKARSPTVALCGGSGCLETREESECGSGARRSAGRGPTGSQLWEMTNPQISST